MKNTRARVEYRGPNAHAGTNFLASAWCLQMHMGQTFNYSAELAILYCFGSSRRLLSIPAASAGGSIHI